MAEPTNHTTVTEVPSPHHLPAFLEDVSPGTGLLGLVMAWGAAVLWIRKKNSKTNFDVAVDKANIDNVANLTKERNDATKAQKDAFERLIADAGKLGSLEAEVKALNREIKDLKEEADTKDGRITRLEAELIQCRAAEGRVRAEMQQLMEFMAAFLPKEAVDLMHAKVYQITDISKELLDEQGLFDRRQDPRLSP